MIGRGRGLGTVLRTLRESGTELTVIVAGARYVGAGPHTGSSASAIAELRQSLEALTDDRAALSRALRRPLTIDRLGRHPLGDLVLQSLSSAFGDLEAASSWLGGQLGINGSVLPATMEPLTYTIDTEAPGTRDAAPGRWHATDRMRFEPENPAVSRTAIEAIARPGWILLAPGPVFSGVLSAAAIPEITRALRMTPGRVAWICNLAPEGDETANDQLAVIRRHGVRVDAILYDPHARLRLTAAPLANDGIIVIATALQAPGGNIHDQRLLRVALDQLISAGYQHA